MDQFATCTDALSRQEAYQYDPDGNLTQFLVRKGQASTFTYDALNRRTGATYADGSTVTFTFDAVGRLTRVTDSVSGAIDFYYDTLDRLILEVTPQAAVAYAYDVLGRRTSMAVAGQASVTYQYDADSRLTQVAQGSLTVTLGYDAAGRRTSLTYPNGTSTSYTYDNASRVTTILHSGPGSTTIESLTYTYDAAGNRTSLTRANSTASLLPAAVATTAYDAANEQTQFGTSTLTYDANGNLTNDGTNTYTWDARNRLVSISGGVTASFAYDALGRRLSKTINGVTTSYLYDGNDIVQEISGGAVTATYLRSLNIDEPFIRQTGTGEFYHTDALGSTVVLSNASGTPATTYTYEPFGNTTMAGTSANPFQFTGRENDGLSVYYYRSRFLGQLFQRFLSEDLLRLPGQNPFIYVLNNPLRFRDPFGLEQVDVFAPSTGSPVSIELTGSLALVPSTTDQGAITTESLSAAVVNSLPDIGSIAVGAGLIGAGLLHGVAVGAIATTITDTAFNAYELDFFIHAGMALDVTLAMGVAASFGGGYLVGQGINGLLPYFGTGRFGGDVYNFLHPPSIRRSKSAG